MTEAEKLFEEYKSLERIERAVAEEQQEGLYLEFKTAQLDDGKLSKPAKSDAKSAIGALANSSGGIIVWGILAQSTRGSELEGRSAVRKEPISNVQLFRERLADFPATEHRQPGVEHVVVPEGAEEGYVVTLVPQSARKPVMSADHIFYIRSSSNSTAMSEALVRALVLARAKPELLVSLGEITCVWKVQSKMFHYGAPLLLQNVGEVIAKNIGIMAWTKVAKAKAHISTNVAPRDQIDVHTENGILKLSHLPQYQIFPGVTVSIGSLGIWSERLLTQAKLEVQLYADEYNERQILNLQLQDVIPQSTRG